MKFLFSLLVLSVSFTAQAQYFSGKVMTRLEKHLEYLASDELGGRYPGTEGEIKAAEYIAGQFKKAGLKIISKDLDYFQQFKFANDVEYTANNTLQAGDFLYRLDSNYYVVSSSGNASVSATVLKVGKGVHAPSRGYSDYSEKVNRTGMIFWIETGLSEEMTAMGINSDLPEASIDSRIRAAIEQGAGGIIFTVPSGSHDYPSMELNPKITPYNIPIVCIMSDEGALHDGVTATVTTELTKIYVTGTNVAGWVDNGAANTVIIGAHYDHLGMGDPSHSLYRGEPAIHNGADDNASGTAMLMELAYNLAKSGYKNNNYMFIAFSGEEEGLLGSKFMVESELFKAFQSNYMINMDMVGRMDTADYTLVINGAGTSPEWKDAIAKATVDGLKVKTTESGIGPSDQTSFYLAGIPAIHFFSGTHSDYHKPSDDADKINYDGMADIGNMILNLVAVLDTAGKLTYSKTQDNQGTASNFKVTLGVIPDYAYDGEGLKIDGVTDGKPAANAGIQAGDIVVQLGEHPVKDIYAYMETLGKFSKGETTKVKVRRSGSELEMEITF